MFSPSYNPASPVHRDGRRYSLRCEPSGCWTLTGALGGNHIEFDDLRTALSFARADAHGGAADLELWVDGLYIFVHQAQGWPHRICADTTTA